MPVAISPRLRRPLAELALRPHDAVGAQRFDRGGKAPTRVLQPGLFAIGQGAQHADIPRAAQLAAQLGGAEDCGAARDIGVGGTGESARGGAADAPGVKEVGAGKIEAPVVVRPAGAEVEDRRSLDEEGSLLGVEGLNVAQVHHCRVDLHLAEIGVDRGIQRHIAADAQLEVRAGARREAGAVIERIVGGMLEELGLAGDVGQDFQSSRRAHLLHAGEIGEARHESALLPWHHDEVGGFVPTGDLPHEVDAPGVALALLEPKLGVRNAHLNRPAEGVARHLGLPVAIPRIVVPVVVQEGAVVEAARRVHPEVVSGPAVMIGIEEHHEGIAGDSVVPPGQPRDDRIGVGVEQPRTNVQGRVVVLDPHFGHLGRCGTLLRLPLLEAGDDLRIGPARLMQCTIEDDRSGCPDGTHPRAAAGCRGQTLHRSELQERGAEHR